MKNKYFYANGCTACISNKSPKRGDYTSNNDNLYNDFDTLVSKGDLGTSTKALAKHWRFILERVKVGNKEVHIKFSSYKT